MIEQSKAAPAPNADAKAGDTERVVSLPEATADNENAVPAYEIGGRDLRVDFIRGLIMMSVISVHAFMLSAVSFFFWERVGIVSSGEGFVLLSGIVLGLVYTRALQKRGFPEVREKIFKRAAQLYRTYLGVSFAIILLRWIPGVKTDSVTTFVNKMTGQVYPLFPAADAPLLQIIARVCRLQAGPHQYQVIGLYVVLMVFAPFLILALHRGHTRMVLGVSWALYFANVIEATRFSWGAFEYAFPTYLWQVLFVHGLALGTHWPEVNAWLWGPRGKVARYVALALSLGFALFSWNHPQPNLVDWVQLRWVPAPVFYDIYGAYFSKTTLGIGRVLNVACLFICMMWAVTHWWSPLARTVGRFLIPIGQATLYVFIVHVFMILLLNQFPWAEAPGFWLATAIHCTMIAAVYLMVRYKVLYSIIPR